MIRKAQWLGKGEAPTASRTTVAVSIPAVTEEAAKKAIEPPAVAESAADGAGHEAAAVHGIRADRGMPASPSPAPAAAGHRSPGARGGNRDAHWAIGAIASGAWRKTSPSMC